MGEVVSKGALVRISRVVASMLALALVFELGGPASALVTPVRVVGGKGNQFNPFSNGTWVAWSSNANHPRHYDAFARRLSGGSVRRLNAAGTQGFSGGIDVTARAIFQEIRDGSSDLRYVNLSNGNRGPVPGANTKKWEYMPRVSATYVFFVRSLRRNGVWYDDLLLLDRASGNARRITSYRYSKNADVFLSNVGDRYATWTRCTRDTCAALVYDAQDGRTRKIPTKNGRPQYAAVVDEANGQLYFVRSGAKCGVDVNIWRVPVATLGGTLTRIVDFPDGIDTGWTLDLAPGASGVDAYFQRWNCATTSGDIYRAVSVDAV
jgi:hypothetical protein